MAGLQTQVTDKNVSAYLDTVEPDSKREDGKVLLELMEKATGNEAKIWGKQNMIGFGKYQYQRKGGKETFEWFNVGFAVRKTKLTVYLTLNLDKETALLEKLGKCKFGKGCLYINKLADVDLEVLKKLVDKSKDASWYS